MKYLKRFNESKEEMTDKDRRAVVKKVKAEIKDNKDYKDEHRMKNILESGELHVKK